MKLSELKKPFEVINKFEGYVGYASFSIEPNKSRTVDPLHCSEKFLEALEILHKQEKVDFKFDVIAEDKATPKMENVEKIKDSTVFNPLISVEEVDLSNSKAINVGKSELEKIEESQDFLSQHWKTIERDLPTLTRDEVAQHLRVAKQDGLTGKKVEMLEGQLSQLS